MTPLEQADLLRLRADAREARARVAVVEAAEAVDAQRFSLETLEQAAVRAEAAVLDGDADLSGAWLQVVGGARQMTGQLRERIAGELAAHEADLADRRVTHHGAVMEQHRAEKVASMIHRDWIGEVERRLQQELDETAQLARIAESREA